MDKIIILINHEEFEFDSGLSSFKRFQTNSNITLEFKQISENFLILKINSLIFKLEKQTELKTNNTKILWYKKGEEFVINRKQKTAKPTCFSYNSTIINLTKSFFSSIKNPFLMLLYAFTCLIILKNKFFKKS